MSKTYRLAAAIVFLAILFAWQGGQSAEKASKDAAPKGAEKAMEKGTPSGAPKGSPGAAASNATANAAKAFEKVSARALSQSKAGRKPNYLFGLGRRALARHNRRFREKVSRYQGNLLAGPKPGNRHSCSYGISGRPGERR